MDVQSSYKKSKLLIENLTGETLRNSSRETEFDYHDAFCQNQFLAIVAH